MLQPAARIPSQTTVCGSTLSYGERRVGIRRGYDFYFMLVNSLQLASRGNRIPEERLHGLENRHVLCPNGVGILPIIELDRLTVE